jgi:hypothetical protein
MFWDHAAGRYAMLLMTILAIFFYVFAQCVQVNDAYAAASDNGICIDDADGQVRYSLMWTSVAMFGVPVLAATFDLGQAVYQGVRDRAAPAALL